MSLSLQNRVAGSSILGGALGDAWGGASEGRGDTSERTSSKALELSDDTQLTIATCEAILAQGEVDPESIAATFMSWYRDRRLSGLGSSTLKAMRDLANGVHWALAGARGEYAAGNGAAMRVAPLAFLLDPGLETDRTLIRDVCRITHHSDEAYIGALAVLAAIRSVVAGELSGDSRWLRLIAGRLPDSSVRDRIVEIAGLRLKPREAATRFGASGYVVDTVPLALLCAQRVTTASLPEALRATVALGGDADTVASICGQIAGTVVGGDGVPRESLLRVEGIDEVIRIAEDFAALVVDQRVVRE